MRPLRLRLEEARKRLRIPWDVLERDYLLSRLLAGIGQIEALRGTLVFKGGTALKKCYFGDHRFSEDLDFSTVGTPPTGDAMQSAIRLSHPVQASQVKAEFQRARHLVHTGFGEISAQRVNLWLISEGTAQFRRVADRPEDQDCFSHRANRSTLGHDRQSWARFPGRQAAAEVIQHRAAIVWHESTALINRRRGQEFRIAEAVLAPPDGLHDREL